MTLRWMRRGFTLPLLYLAFGLGCGDEDDAAEPAIPEGCYIEANRLCDCDIEEAACDLYASYPRVLTKILLLFLTILNLHGIYSWFILGVAELLLTMRLTSVLRLQPSAMN